ncbi:MAG TPA: hypothetical protein EYH56_00700 [Nanoarchaeota archaeon]|nr:hypothetical protein [Nanoarchaeota archaeon]
MLSEKEIKKKIKKGYLRVWMTFEVMGTAEDIVKKAIEEHVEKFEKDNRTEVYKKEFSNVEKIQIEGKTLFSVICEVEFLSKNFRDLINLVLIYGPSACEILEPERIEIELNEAQDILNTLGGIMHRLAERIGGIVVKRE